METRYPALRTISGIVKTMAIVLFVVAGIGIMHGLGSLQTTQDGPFAQRGTTNPFAVAELGVSILIGSWGLFLLASAEYIKVVLAIEENTRSTAMRSGGSPPPVPTVALRESRCGNCGKYYPADLKGQYCEACGAKL